MFVAQKQTAQVWQHPDGERSISNGSKSHSKSVQPHLTTVAVPVQPPSPTVAGPMYNECRNSPQQLSWHSMTIDERIVLLQAHHAYPDEIIILKEAPDLWDAALSLQQHGLARMITSWLDCHTTASIYATDAGRAMLSEPCWTDRVSLLPFIVAQRRAEQDSWRGEVQIGDATIIAWAKGAGGGMAIRHKAFSAINRRGMVTFQSMSQESRLTHAASLLRQLASQGAGL